MMNAIANVNALYNTVSVQTYNKNLGGRFTLRGRKANDNEMVNNNRNAFNMNDYFESLAGLGLRQDFLLSNKYSFAILL